MVCPKSALFARFLAFVLLGGYGSTASGASAGEPASRFEPVVHAADTSYRLGTGDKVRVIVFDETDLGGEFQIDDGGFIRLPLIGQLKAAGYSPRNLEIRIAAA